MNETYVKRKIYLEKISPYIGKDVIKVIVGQRRVGKSYMLLQIMDIIRKKNPGSTIVYINKELNEFSSLKNFEDLLSYIKKQVHASHGKISVFIDEIQEIIGFEKALRSLAAENRYDIYCTGSNAEMLSSEISSSLAGRHIQIEINGLSYLEFLEFHRLENCNASLKKFIRYGGLPYLINLELEDQVVFGYLNSIYNSILYRDIVARYKIRNTAFLERLVEYVADNTGNMLSAKKISDFLKSQKTNISPNIILNYLSFLSSAYFISRVPRSDIFGKKVFEIGEKYYFEDTGLRHSVIGCRPGDIGKIVENMVFLHLKISGYRIFCGKTGTREIDFVCERGAERIYLQATYMITDEKVRDREFGSLLEVKDNYPKFVVSMDENAGGDYKGIRHLNFRDFLSSTR